MLTRIIFPDYSWIDQTHITAITRWVFGPAAVPLISPEKASEARRSDPATIGRLRRDHPRMKRTAPARGQFLRPQTPVEASKLSPWGKGPGSLTLSQIEGSLPGPHASMTLSEAVSRQSRHSRGCSFDPHRVRIGRLQSAHSTKAPVLSGCDRRRGAGRCVVSAPLRYFTAWRWALAIDA